MCKCMAVLELHEIHLKMKLAEKKAERKTGESQGDKERQSHHPVIRVS